MKKKTDIDKLIKMLENNEMVEKTDTKPKGNCLKPLDLEAEIKRQYWKNKLKGN